MSLDCNSIKNKKSKQLIDGIESWVNKEKVGKNIQAPYEAAISMFEAMFQMPIEASVLLTQKQGSNLGLTAGSTKAYLDALDKYADRVSEGKLNAFNGFEGFMTGTWLSKNDPVLFETLKNIRGIMESDNKRRNSLNTSFGNVLKKIRAAGELSGGKYTEKDIKKSLVRHRNLELEYTKALDSGDDIKIQDAKSKLTDFESKGPVKRFVDFIKIVEDLMPDAIQAKYNDEVALAESGLNSKETRAAKKRVKEYDSGEKLVRIDSKEYYSYLERAGIPEPLWGAVKDYNEMMTDSYKDLRNGIKKVVESTVKRIEGRPEFRGTAKSLENLQKKLISELMPKYKEDGYFPHFVRDLNATMMDGLMKNIDDLNTADLDLVREKKSIDDIIDDMNFWITNHAKTRSRDGDYEYSKNFVDVVNTYLHNVNSFNTTAFLNDSYMNALNHARKTYTKDSDYSNKILSIINSIHGSVKGNTREQGSLNLIKRTLLAYQFTNKLGFSFRSAARNATQILMNLPTFTFSGVREANKFLKQNNVLSKFNLENELKEANLLMNEASEAAIESEIKVEKKSPYKIRKMDENGKIIYTDEENFAYKGLKIFSRGMSKLAQTSSGMHRGIENANRKLTAKIAFGSIYKAMDENPQFVKFLESKVDTEGSIESQKRKYAQAYAKNMVILNHFDYASYAKAKNLREGIGQFVFQFQHYAMEFIERNYAIAKEAKGDYDVRKESDNYSEWFADARGVHKVMNMFNAYFVAPALISYLTGLNQTLVEHTGKEFLEDLWTLFTTDFDDQESIEKLNRNFYGKGIVGSKLGPTFGTLLDIAVASELVNADEDYLNNLILNTGDFTNNDNTDVSIRNIKFYNQFAGRLADRYIPMIVKNPYSWSTAAFQELTLYPRKKSEQSFMRDVLPPLMKEYPTSMPFNSEIRSYYFDRLKKKTKKKKHSGMSIGMQNALRELERAGKR